MQAHGHLPVVQRSLLDRPQALGFLPTLWFWNHRERQILLLPLAALTILPATYALSILILRLHLPIWGIFAFALLSPFLLMGIVERHLRRELVRLPRAPRNDHAAPPRPSGSVLPAMLAGLCALTAMAFASGLGLANVAVILGVVLVGCLFPPAWRELHRRVLTEQTRTRLPPGEGSPG